MDISHGIPGSWITTKVPNIDSCITQLNEGSYGFVIIPTKQIDSTIKNYLFSLKDKAPMTRRVIIVEEMNSEDVRDLINHGLAHRILKLDISSDRLLKVLHNLADDYKSFLNRRSDLGDEETLNSNLISSYDQFLDLSLNLFETEEIHDFTNQFVSIIEGLMSLTRLNISMFYDEKKKSSVFKNVMTNLSDLEIMANQYDQQLLLIYLNILQAYLYLEHQRIDSAMNHYKNCIRTFYWIDQNHIEDELVEYINSFPVQEDEWYYIKTGQLDFEMSSETEVYTHQVVKNLLAMDMRNLISITKSLVKHLELEQIPVQSLVIARDSLPVFIIGATPTETNSDLITGFVDALSAFLQEIVKGEGNIDKITPDTGIILCHKIEDFRYMLLAKADDAYMRIALRQYARDTLDIVKKVPLNQFADNSITSELTEKFAQVFRIRKQPQQR